MINVLKLKNITNCQLLMRKYAEQAKTTKNCY